LIEDPVIKDKDGNVKVDQHGQAVLRYGQTEVRLSDEIGFALYPGEKLVKVEKLVWVPQVCLKEVF
jgi:hypothetical protein